MKNVMIDLKIHLPWREDPIFLHKEILAGAPSLEGAMRVPKKTWDAIDRKLALQALTSLVMAAEREIQKEK